MARAARRAIFLQAHVALARQSCSTLFTPASCLYRSDPSRRRRRPPRTVEVWICAWDVRGGRLGGECGGCWPGGQCIRECPREGDGEEGDGDSDGVPAGNEERGVTRRAQRPSPREYNLAATPPVRRPRCVSLPPFCLPRGCEDGSRPGFGSPIPPEAGPSRPVPSNGSTLPIPAPASASHLRPYRNQPSKPSRRRPAPAPSVECGGDDSKRRCGWGFGPSSLGCSRTGPVRCV
ncbi:hypothetical protein B0H13DRAFT_1982768 [Mycena leptocephala]|nr:hypothetical protein B0H13DRAFT_1982768 [Mycena leptocephala]